MRAIPDPNHKDMVSNKFVFNTEMKIAFYPTCHFKVLYVEFQSLKFTVFKLSIFYIVNIMDLKINLCSVNDTYVIPVTQATETGGSQV